MRRGLRAAAFLAGALVFLLLLPAPPLRAGDAGLATVVTQAGGRYAFHVEIADTPETRARGLMYRSRLADDAGMLFLFDALEVQTFWMKNTEIALDMLFLAPDGEILSLHENATPFSLRTISSGVPASAVLEIVGGTSARLGIRVGDRVEHPALR